MFNYNPYNMYQEQTLTRVTGLDGAKAFQMRPNSTAALFDANEDIMFIKSTDGAGFPTIRTFKFEEVGTPKQSNDYVSKDEFEELKREVEKYGQQFIQYAASHQSTNGAVNQINEVESSPGPITNESPSSTSSSNGRQWKSTGTFL